MVMQSWHQFLQLVRFGGPVEREHVRRFSEVDTGHKALCPASRRDPGILMLVVFRAY